MSGKRFTITYSFFSSLSNAFSRFMDQAATAPTAPIHLSLAVTQPYSKQLLDPPPNLTSSEATI